MAMMPRAPATRRITTANRTELSEPSSVSAARGTKSPGWAGSRWTVVVPGGWTTSEPGGGTGPGTATVTGAATVVAGLAAVVGGAVATVVAGAAAAEVEMSMDQPPPICPALPLGSGSF